MTIHTRWQSIASAVAAAMSAPPSHWNRLLSDALDGDDSRIARAKQLLDHQSSIAAFLEEPAVLPSGAIAGPRLSAGVRIGERYEVERWLGAGAMGEVYQAFDREIGERVALKVIHPDISPDASSRDRFRRELKLGRQVRHASVCQLYDLVTAPLPDGTPLVFLTMELLPGETLEQAIGRDGAFGEAEAVRLAEQLLDGLGAAHAKGILHGDLKCSNVILRPAADGAGCYPVLTDFGLSRRLGPSPLDSINVRDDGAIMGTPAYMAPEQIMGEPLTEAADIHAFGVMLFRMVTGRLPFDRHTARDAMWQRLYGTVPRPRHYAPRLSDAVETAILACLARDATDRPHSVAEVHALLAGRPHRLHRRRLVAAVAVTLLSGASALGWHTWSSPEAMNPEITSHLKLAEEFLARRGAGDFQQAIAEFKQALALDPKRTAAWIGLAEAYSGAANWGIVNAKDGLRSARDAIDRAAVLAPNDARVQAQLGYIISIDVERWKHAEGYFQRALELNPRDDKAQFWYATHLGRLGRQDDAIALLKKVLLATPQSFSVQHQLAMEYYRAARNHEFLAHAAEVVRIQPNLPNSHFTLARAYVQNGRFADAASECRHAETLGADRAQFLAVMAVVQHETGDLAAYRKSRLELDTLWTERPVETNSIAAASAIGGDAAAAVTYLNAGFDRGDSSVLVAHVTPWFDRIRTDPRFVQFVRRTGIEP